MSRPTTDGDDETEREVILSLLGSRIRSIDERVEEMAEDGSWDDGVLIRWTRTLGYLAGQYRKLMKDRDIDEMEAEVESLAEELNSRNP